MKKVLFFIFVLVSTCCYGATKSATGILEAMCAKITSSASLDVDFTINGGQGAVSGHLTMSGPAYVMTTPQLKVWYNGTTQWTMIESTGEVSITEPELAEIMESNPFTILNHYQGFYKALRLPDSGGRYQIELTPLKPRDTNIKSVRVSVNPNNYPAKVLVTFTNGDMIDAAISKIIASGRKDPKIFEYDGDKYPAIEIIDLR